MSPASENAPYWVTNRTARALWEAYHRMLAGTPKRVKPTARMTLSSVAVEAGFQRSTLSRKRYPDLTELIEQSAAKKPVQTMHALLKKKSKANANLRDKLAKLAGERGILLNRLASLEQSRLIIAQEADRNQGRPDGARVVPISRSNNGY